MSYTLKPISTIEQSLNIEDNGKGQKFFTNNCYRHMNKYVPFRTGMLATKVEITDDTITYKSPYAHRQYIGLTKKGTVFNYSRRMHPLASRLWDQKMVTAEGKIVAKETEQYIRRLNGN